jgi:hypothetical protein
MKELVTDFIYPLCVVMITIGIWGVITSESDTEVGWQLWGWMLAIITISFPTISFWWDKMNWLLDLED